VVEGEADFVVLDPRRGMVVLEVKGGIEVGRDSAGWYSISRTGTRHRIKDPGAQAQTAAHRLGLYVRDGARGGTALSRLNFGWGVVFPDFQVGDSLGVDLPRSFVLDAHDLGNPDALEPIFDRQGLKGPALTAKEAASFVDTLLPRFRLVPALRTNVSVNQPVGLRLESERQQLIRLTEEQAHVLDLLASNPRVAVQGGAGTGKTQLAVELARRLSKDGARVLLLCFNRLLADSIMASADGFAVSSFHKFCRDRIRQAGLPFNVPQEDEGEFWGVEAPEALMKALDVYPDERWDAVIVDEAQDFRELWWLAIEKMLAADSETLWAFFDPAQDLFGGDWTRMIEGAVPASLSRNCRNTRRIARQACERVGIEPAFFDAAPEGEEVSVLAVKSEAELVDAVRRQLHVWVTEKKLSSQSILLLSSRARGACPVWRRRKLGNLTLVEYPQPPAANEVRYSTVHRFKGLEADAVIFCDFSASEVGRRSPIRYVAESRAKHVLASVSLEAGAA
jgi:ATP:corrinoid adenosyltransferase